MQNRVDPFGNIIETKARGTWMGNRGLLHNENREIVRHSKLKAWLICQLEFKNWWRPVMAPNRYTELFFLDEATALAAGHRPCCECRRADFNRFKSLWIQANPEHGLNARSSIKQLDLVLESERKNKDGSKNTYPENIADLPNGVFISFEDQAYLVHQKQTYLWTPFGYQENSRRLNVEKIPVLTPPSIVATIRAGYSPQIDLP